MACAAGVAFIAGIALALALVASSAGGGDHIRALVAAAPRQKSFITRSLPGLAEAQRTAAPVSMSPMNAFERKVVHDVVAEAGLVSESEGEDPDRRVVIRTS